MAEQSRRAKMLWATRDYATSVKHMTEMSQELRWAGVVSSVDEVLAELEASRAKCALLAAEVEGLRKDAERLDFLEDCPATRAPDNSPMRRWLWARPFGIGSLRAAIDAALSSAAAAPINQGDTNV